MPQCTCGVIRFQLLGVGSLLPPCGCFESKMVHQTWWQVPAPLTGPRTDFIIYKLLNCLHCFHIKTAMQETAGGWRDGSAVKSTCCSCRGPSSFPIIHWGRWLTTIQYSGSRGIPHLLLTSMGNLFALAHLENLCKVGWPEIYPPISAFWVLGLKMCAPCRPNNKIC